MQNYALEELFFSLNPEEEELLKTLEQYEKELNFPAVKKDVGSLLNFLTSFTSPKNIFEFGSGYGHSAFWYLQANAQSIESIHLTEKRDDLEEVFETLPWPKHWREKLCYHQGDAFESLESLDEKLLFDLVLVDGVKAQYQTFLKTIHSRLSQNSIVVVDNCFWKGRFLDDKELHKTSPKAIKELHEWLKKQELYRVSFLPISDGIFLLKKI